MSTAGSWASFVELPRAQCEGLLAAHAVGRVAWNDSDGPQVLPVNYAWHIGQVILRTAAYGPLATLAQRTPVAFEVDHFDEPERTGWSVLVRGFSEGITRDRELTRLWSSDAVVPWAAGSRTLFIAITPRTVTGREVRA